MDPFFDDATYQDNPLRILKDFLKKEKAFEETEQYKQMRFVGYVLEIGFDQAKIITSDPFKQAVGGIPRGSFLIMAPDKMDGLPPHFTLLRVVDIAPTPLGDQVQQTYFELHKKSMPELDVWTQGELQWGALNTKILGMYYPSPQNSSKLTFSGDVNSVVSGHRYRIYAPTDDLLDLIANGTVTEGERVPIGNLRLTECQLPFANIKQPNVKVQISTKDFKGFRTAMFGKTRLGKSNVVKLIAQAIIDATDKNHSVGQLIFDINGEYANDNPQDDNRSLRSVNESRCTVYSLKERDETPSRPLKLNFYEQPDSCLPILAGLLEEYNQTAHYVRAFATVEMPNIASTKELREVGEKIRAFRKIQMYWAILHRAGFRSDEKRLNAINLHAGTVSRLDPGFSTDLREAVWGKGKAPAPPNSLDALCQELEKTAFFVQENGDAPVLKPKGKETFDSHDKALLGFLKPKTGSGPIVLRSFQSYHNPQASDIVVEILKELDSGRTVILDLGNADDRLRKYFSDLLSRAVFSHQEKKFTSNKFGDHYIQIYFEEAHNLFPRDSKGLTDVYSRFAKEGAKFRIGMVYSTQSPSTISQELLVQTENFFVGHLASVDEAKSLSRQQIAFSGVEEDILRSRTPGYMRMLTFSHRFVVPIQAFRYGAVAAEHK